MGSCSPPKNALRLQRSALSPRVSFTHHAELSLSQFTLPQPPVRPLRVSTSSPAPILLVWRIPPTSLRAASSDRYHRRASATRSLLQRWWLAPWTRVGGVGEQTAGEEEEGGGRADGKDEEGGRRVDGSDYLLGDAGEEGGGVLCCDEDGRRRGDEQHFAKLSSDPILLPSLRHSSLHSFPSLRSSFGTPVLPLPPAFEPDSPFHRIHRTDSSFAILPPLLPSSGPWNLLLEPRLRLLHHLALLSFRGKAPLHVDPRTAGRLAEWLPSKRVFVHRSCRKKLRRDRVRGISADAVAGRERRARWSAEEGDRESEFWRRARGQAVGSSSSYFSAKCTR